MHADLSTIFWIIAQSHNSKVGRTGMSMLGKVKDLFRILEEAYRAENRPGGDAAVSSLAAAQKANIKLNISDSAPLELLGLAVKQSLSLPVSSTIFDCSPYFRWENWAKETLEKDIASNLFTTELVGPDGLVYDPNVRVGLLISAANTDYPVSSHSGEETYFVISGKAEWTMEDRVYKPIGPGSIVHHPSWVPHGRRTLNDVFLGAWRWSGDLNLESFRIDS